MATGIVASDDKNNFQKSFNNVNREQRTMNNVQATIKFLSINYSHVMCDDNTYLHIVVSHHQRSMMNMCIGIFVCNGMAATRHTTRVQMTVALLQWFTRPEILHFPLVSANGERKKKWKLIIWFQSQRFLHFLLWFLLSVWYYQRQNGIA